MKCIDLIRQTAEAMGASLDVDEYAMHADARPGYVWIVNDCSVLTMVYRNTGGQQWAVDACRDLSEEIGRGMRKCDAEEAAQVEYERDEPWTAPADAPEIITPS